MGVLRNYLNCLTAYRLRSDDLNGLQKSDEVG